MKKPCMKWLRFARLFLALGIAVCVASTARAELMTWDLTADFSGTGNPNGDWTYGVYLEDALKPSYGPFYTWPAYYNWAGSSLNYYGNAGNDLSAGVIFHNPTSGIIANGNQFFLPGQVLFFPANLGYAYDAVVRWTAPRDMTVSIDALFTGQDEIPDTDVHVLLNGYINDGNESTGWDPIIVGSQLFSGLVDGNVGCAEAGILPFGTSPSQSYSGVVSVKAGDTIDFWAGYGPDHFYGSDLTGVSATISEIPEPGCLVLLATGLIGLVYLRRRK